MSNSQIKPVLFFQKFFCQQVHFVVDERAGEQSAEFIASFAVNLYLKGWSRDFNPTYGWLEWNHVYNRYEVTLALLSKDTPSPFIQKDAGMPKVSCMDLGSKNKLAYCCKYSPRSIFCKEKQ